MRKVSTRVPSDGASPMGQHGWHDYYTASQVPQRGNKPVSRPGEAAASQPGTAPRTEAGADDAVESQVAAVLDAVGDVRPGRPEPRLRLPRPAVRLRPARGTKTIVLSKNESKHFSPCHSSEIAITVLPPK